MELRGDAAIQQGAPAAASFQLEEEQMTLARKSFKLSAIAISTSAAISLAALNGATAQDAGGNFNTTGKISFTPLPFTDTVVGEVRLALPGAGIVIVNASSWATFDTNPAGVECQITRTVTISGTQPVVVGQNHNETNARRMPITATRGFVESGAATRKYRFVCRTQVDTWQADLNDVVVTAIYVPNRYGPPPAAAAAAAEDADDSRVD
jgi:hypothetical protein